MKVEFKNNNVSRNIWQIPDGKVFKLENKYYLKVGSSFQVGANAVSLDTFTAVFLDDVPVWEIPDENVHFIVEDC